MFKKFSNQFIQATALWLLLIGLISTVQVISSRPHNKLIASYVKGLK